jgi:hypothetical protein
MSIGSRPSGNLTTGAPIAAVARKPEHLDLWVTRDDGEVYSAWWDVDDGWSSWFSIGGPPGGLTTGAPIAAVARKPEHLDLWVTGGSGFILGGQVWSAWWDVDDGWSSWFAL